MTLTEVAPTELEGDERDDYIVRRVIDDKQPLRVVAKEVNRSRERVRQIVEKSGESIKEARKSANPNAGTRSCRICEERYKSGRYEQHCKEAGHRQLVPPGEKTERNEEIVWLYVFGEYNTTEIAEYEDLPQPVITRILHRYGIRPIGRRRRKGGLGKRSEGTTDE